MAVPPSSGTKKAISALYLGRCAVSSGIPATLPQGAVTERNNVTYATVQNSDGTTQEKEIVIGATSSVGTVEIISGLTEGEKIVVPIQK